ncbi:MAG: hypothetical protein QF823_00970 [Candidatus Marinimicrobia bacterium]|nr:hypothetical protein [Candidatus Neomarinimicrobiota bacterium]|tara:strand:+ start:21700 stop:21831 length:132 start_codon:yes stop_codon:yes gene_type:complete
MYNFYGYFLAVYLIVFGTIAAWFVIQLHFERRYLKEENRKQSE